MTAAELSAERLQEIAQGLLDYAAEIDPGMAASVFSTSDRQQRKHRAIAQHYIAYGIRHALIELGLHS